jgi:molecular chaperone HtpG
MNADAGTQSHQFQAEVAELLSLMVHSVYSETDVFLRELISNASDALDKLRYEAISNPALLVGAEKLAIQLKPDALAKTLTIADTGIGMPPKHSGGLGMRLVKALIGQLDTTMTIESPVPQSKDSPDPGGGTGGTRVTIIVPGPWYAD